MVLELRPYQQDALERMKNGCVLKGGVGSGKSIMSVAYYKRHHLPLDVVVVTTAKKKQSREWEAEFARIAIGTDKNISYKGVTLEVISWNKLPDYVDLIKGKFVIFDEQRAVGSGSWAKSMIKVAQNNYWVMLSATPGDTWIEFAPLFIANGFYKNRTEFIREHVVYSTFTKFPKIDRYINTERLWKIRRYLEVEVPYEKHTTRHENLVKVDYDLETFNKVWKDRWHIYEDRPIRDVAEMFMVARRVVTSDPSRIEKLAELVQTNNRLIVFYMYNYELDILRQFQPEGYEIAEWNGQKHEDIPRSDKWLYLVQYTAGAEGWNCITTDAMVFYSLNYSYKAYEQAHGRIDRMNTPYSDLHYYVFRDTSQIDRMVWSALSRKENFNLGKYAKSHGWE